MENVASNAMPARTCAWSVDGGFHVRIVSDTILDWMRSHTGELRNHAVMLILDYSGSMGIYKRRLNETVAAIAEAAIASGTGDRLIGVLFGDRADVLQAHELAQLRNTDVSAPTVIGARTVNVGCGTHYERALSAAADALQHFADHYVTALFMTDGDSCSGGKVSWRSNCSSAAPRVGPLTNEMRTPWSVSWRRCSSSASSSSTLAAAAEPVVSRDAPMPLYLAVAQTRLRTQERFDLQPVLFAYHPKSHTQSQKMIDVLYKLHCHAHTETITRDDFVLHRLRYVSDGSDGLTQTLQAARGLLVSNVTMSAIEHHRGGTARLTLSARGRAAVGFLTAHESHPESVTSLTVRIHHPDLDDTLDVQVPIVSAPAADEHDPSVLVQLHALLHENHTDAGDTIARAHAYLLTQADNDDGARLLMQQLEQWWSQVRARAHASSCASTSSMQTRAPESLLQLLSNVGSMASIGARGNDRRVSLRFQRAVANMDVVDMSRSLARVEECVRRGRARDTLPDWMQHDMQLDELGACDAAFIVMDAPGCSIQASSSDDEFSRMISVAMNNAAAVRARPVGWLTRASLAANVARNIEPLRRRMIVLFPTRDIDVLRALAGITVGSLLTGELVTLPPQSMDALLAVASAVLDVRDDVVDDLTTTAWTHAVALYKSVYIPVADDDAPSLTPMATARARDRFNKSYTARTLRMGLMQTAIGLRETSIYTLVVELLRKRVIEIARSAHAHHDLAAHEATLLQCMGLDSVARQTGRDLLERAAGGGVGAVCSVYRAIKRHDATTMVPLPESMDMHVMLRWIESFVGDTTTAAYEPYMWSECPTWNSFARAYISARQLRAHDSAWCHGDWMTTEQSATLCARARVTMDARDVMDSIVRDLEIVTNARTLFDVALQTVRQVDTTRMERLRGLPSRAPDSDEQLSPTVRLVLMRGRSATPGDPYDRTLAEVIAANEYSAMRPFISAELVMQRDSHTRSAMMRAYDMTDDEIDAEFVTQSQPTRASKFAHPRSRVFHRRLNWLCRRIGLIEARAYNRAEVVAKLKATGVQDSNAWWVLQGVTMEHDCHAGRLRIASVAGVRRNDDDADARLVAIYDANDIESI